MAEIINFPAKTAEKEEKSGDTLIWVCNNCGCQSFFLHSTGDTECCGCNAFSGSEDDTGRRLRLPPEPENPEEIGTDTTILAVLGDDLAKKRVVKRIEDEDIIIAAAIRREGGMFWWTSGFETPDQRAWFEEHLDELKKCILKAGEIKG